MYLIKTYFSIQKSISHLQQKYDFSYNKKEYPRKIYPGIRYNLKQTAPWEKMKLKILKILKDCVALKKVY